MRATDEDLTRLQGLLQELLELLVQRAKEELVGDGMFRGFGAIACKIDPVKYYNVVSPHWGDEGCCLDYQDGIDVLAALYALLNQPNLRRHLGHVASQLLALSDRVTSQYEAAWVRLFCSPFVGILNKLAENEGVMDSQKEAWDEAILAIFPEDPNFWTSDEAPLKILLAEPRSWSA